jgi:hypothetical protein
MIVISSSNESKMELYAADMPRLSEHPNASKLRNRVDLNGAASKAHKRKRHILATLTEPHDRHGSDGLHACVDSPVSSGSGEDEDSDVRVSSCITQVVVPVRTASLQTLQTLAP